MTLPAVGQQGVACSVVAAMILLLVGQIQDLMHALHATACTELCE